MTIETVKISLKTLTLSLLLGGLLAGCGGPEPGLQEIPPGVSEDELLAQQDNEELGQEEGLDEIKPAEEVEADIDPRARIDLSLEPNESGKIMVLMYHGIGPEEKEWVRTPENFVKDLTTLYDKGYRPISLTDYVSGNITTEAGFTPVVITFDDALENNFRYLEDGSIDPDSAVGILLDFHEARPDFPLEVTFFADGPVAFGPKAEEKKKVNFIIEQGMDMGNHTLGHANFKKLDQAGLEKQIGYQAAYLEDLIECDNYKVNTLALPYGSRPAEELMGYLARGNYEGRDYENVAILNVGSNPGLSPYHADFDPLSLPRVRASEMKVGNLGLYAYLDYFDKHPEEAFVSDGVAKIVTLPKARESYLQDLDRELYLYETVEDLDQKEETDESDS